MGVLGIGLGLVVDGLSGAVVLAVAALNEAPDGGQGLLGKAQGVGTHIGDEAHGTLALNVHALVELLGDGHGAPRGHAQLPGGLLLHGGGGEGRRGAAVLVAPLHGLHQEGGVLRLPDHGLHFLRRFQLRLFAVPPVVAGGKGDFFRLLTQELGVQGPVLLRLKGLDLPVPVVHHAGGHGLHPARREAPADLLPQQGAQLVAHDAVQNPAGLLGVH